MLSIVTKTFLCFWIDVQLGRSIVSSQSLGIRVVQELDDVQHRRLDTASSTSHGGGHERAAVHGYLLAEKAYDDLPGSAASSSVDSV